MSYFGSKLYGSLSLGPIYTVRLNYETSAESYKLLLYDSSSYPHLLYLFDASTARIIYSNQ